MTSSPRPSSLRVSSLRLGAAAGVAVVALTLAGCGGGAPKQAGTPSAGHATAGAPSSPGTRSSEPHPAGTTSAASPSTATSSATGGGSRTPSTAVTKDEAGRIATDKYGGTVINVESDHYRGKAAWEVEIRNSRQGRIEVKVAKATGEVLHMEHED